MGDEKAVKPAEEAPAQDTHGEVIAGAEIRCLGEAGSRVMLAVFPGKSYEHTRIFEMAAYCAVPYGYRVMEIDLTPAEAMTAETAESDRALIRAVYDKVKADGIANIYLLAYDAAAELSLEALEGQPLTRAYLVSPVFDVPGKKKRKTWKVQTEILYGRQDDVVSAGAIRHFEKNSTSHVTRIDAGHGLKSDDELRALRDWMTGPRRTAYSSQAFLLILLVCAFIGFFFGLFVLNNGGVGTVLGIFLGVLVYKLYCYI